LSQAENLAKGITLIPGDCLSLLATLPADSLDSCVTDPPYHLTSIVKRFGADDAAPVKAGKSGVYARSSAGFMGKQWDGGEIAFEPETWAAVYRVLKPGAHLLAFGATRNFGFMQTAIAQSGFEVRDTIAWMFGSGFPKSHNVGDGWGTALKPAMELVVVARKPLSENTVAANVLRWGTGALNIGACRIPGEPVPVFGTNGGRKFIPGGERDQQVKQVGTNAVGRWPANVVHDGSDEVVEAFPANLTSGTGAVKKATGAGTQANAYGKESRPVGTPNIEYGDSGSAARFFYSSKADSDDRLGSKHPTVKPVDLMQYLVRLVTPKGGTVLDLFAGTGTTGEAALREGFNAVLIERETEYQNDIRRRMKLALSGPDERKRESIKAKTKDQPADAGPLFA
jgi:site-specific DNA-methyltransferase (adenine-specific)